MVYLELEFERFRRGSVKFSLTLRAILSIFFHASTFRFELWDLFIFDRVRIFLWDKTYSNETGTFYC